MKTMLHYVAIGILLAGCNGKHAGNATGGAVSAPPGAGFDSVSLRRTACYGNCPVYTVEVHADGRVRYTGTEHVGVEGVREGTIASADVARLTAAIRRTNLAQMRAAYQFQEDGCTELVTDAPDFAIAVTEAGKTRTVAFYEGCRGPAIPWQALKALASTIDEVARTAPLIKPQTGAARTPAGP